jgi:hypothetical protein
MFGVDYLVQARAATNAYLEKSLSQVLKGTLCLWNDFIFILTYLLMVLEHVKYLSHEGSSAKCEIICHA